MSGRERRPWRSEIRVAPGDLRQREKRRVGVGGVEGIYGRLEGRRECWGPIGPSASRSSVQPFLQLRLCTTRDCAPGWSPWEPVRRVRNCAPSRCLQTAHLSLTSRPPGRGGTSARTLPACGCPSLSRCSGDAEEGHSRSGQDGQLGVRLGWRSRVQHDTGGACDSVVIGGGRSRNRALLRFSTLLN